MAEWKPVIGYEMKYEVSSNGVVRNVVSKIEVRQHTNPDGYMELTLCMEGKQRWFKVHRLVAEAFIGSCPIGKEVNHKDRIRFNNRWDNLEYVTHSENLRHASRNGAKFGAPGEKNGNAILNKILVRKIRKEHESGAFKSYADLSRHLGVAYHLVRWVVNGTTWGSV